MKRTKDFIDIMMDYEASRFQDEELLAELQYRTIKNGYSLLALIDGLEQLKHQNNIINKLINENSN